MFQIILLIMATGGIASRARGRGGHPVVFGALTVVSYLLGEFLARFFGPDSVMQMVLPWLLVGLLAFQVRFILGAGRPKPDSMWACRNCDTVNESNYVVCQACRRPWVPG